MFLSHHEEASPGVRTFDSETTLIEERRQLNLQLSNVRREIAWLLEQYGSQARVSSPSPQDLARLEDLQIGLSVVEEQESLMLKQRARIQAALRRLRRLHRVKNS